MLIFARFCSQINHLLIFFLGEWWFLSRIDRKFTTSVGRAHAIQKCWKCKRNHESFHKNSYLVQIINSKYFYKIRESQSRAVKDLAQIYIRKILIFFKGELWFLSRIDCKVIALVGPAHATQKCWKCKRNSESFHKNSWIVQ